MNVRFAALAALVGVCVVGFPAHAADPLTLDEAFARVADTHPALRLYGTRREVLDAELASAELRPERVLEAGIENVFGSGARTGTGEAEITLGLASVLERGGKRDARRTLAQSRIDALAVERDAQRLDLLAEVARRYLATLSAQQQGVLAQQDIEQRQRVVSEARKRLQAGASPESVVFSAQAALARAELERARAQQRLLASRQHLAALWGERSPDFDTVAGDLLALPPLEDFAVLADWLARTPELGRFVDEGRIREGRLQLARSQTTPDLEWQVGVRRFQADGDFGLVGSVSIPLGRSRRAQPEINAARAELTGLEIEREATGLALYSTLAEAHGRYRIAALEVERLRDDVVPALVKAERATQRAYRAGAASYLEWASLQAEHTAARQQQWNAALEAQLALIEIQRLTGQAFFSRADASNQTGVAP